MTLVPILDREYLLRNVNLTPILSMFAQLLGIPTFIVSKQVVVDFYSEIDRLNYLKFVARRVPRLYEWIVALSYAVSLKNKREVWALFQVGEAEFGSDLIKEAYQCLLDSISTEEIDWLCDNLDGLLEVFDR